MLLHQDHHGFTDFKDFLPQPGIDVDTVLSNADYVALMDVLQTMGVDVVDASRFVCAIRNQNLNTFVELFGSGRMVKTAYDRRRSLNLNGLAAFDIRSLKPDGAPWNFCKESDRDEAREYVLT